MLPVLSFDTFIVLIEVVSSMSSVKLNNNKCDSRIIWDVHCVCLCICMFDNPILLISVFAERMSHWKRLTWSVTELNWWMYYGDFSVFCGLPVIQALFPVWCAMYLYTRTLPLPGEGAKNSAGSISGQCQPFSVASNCVMASRTFCLPSLVHEEFVLHFCPLFYVHNYRPSMSVVLISCRFLCIEMVEQQYPTVLRKGWTVLTTAVFSLKQ